MVPVHIPGNDDGAPPRSSGYPSSETDTTDTAPDNPGLSHAALAEDAAGPRALVGRPFIPPLTLPKRGGNAAGVADNNMARPQLPPTRNGRDDGARQESADIVTPPLSSPPTAQQGVGRRGEQTPVVAPLTVAAVVRHIRTGLSGGGGSSGRAHGLACSSPLHRLHSALLEEVVYDRQMNMIRIVSPPSSNEERARPTHRTAQAGRAGQRHQHYRGESTKGSGRRVRAQRPPQPLLVNWVGDSQEDGAGREEEPPPHMLYADLASWDATVGQRVRRWLAGVQQAISRNGDACHSELQTDNTGNSFPNNSHGNEVAIVDPDLSPAIKFFTDIKQREAEDAAAAAKERVRKEQEREERRRRTAATAVSPKAPVLATGRSQQQELLRSLHLSSSCENNCSPNPYLPATHSSSNLPHGGGSNVPLHVLDGVAMREGEGNRRGSGQPVATIPPALPVSRAVGATSSQSSQDLIRATSPCQRSSNTSAPVRRFPHASSSQHDDDNDDTTGPQAHQPRPQPEQVCSVYNSEPNLTSATPPPMGRGRRNSFSFTDDRVRVGSASSAAPAGNALSRQSSKGTAAAPRRRASAAATAAAATSSPLTSPLLATGGGRATLTHRGSPSGLPPATAAPLPPPPSLPPFPHLAYLAANSAGPSPATAGGTPGQQSAHDASNGGSVGGGAVATLAVPLSIASGETSASQADSTSPVGLSGGGPPPGLATVAIAAASPSLPQFARYTGGGGGGSGGRSQAWTGNHPNSNLEPSFVQNSSGHHHNHHSHHPHSAGFPVNGNSLWSLVNNSAASTSAANLAMSVSFASSTPLRSHQNSTMLQRTNTYALISTSYRGNSVESSVPSGSPSSPFVTVRPQLQVLSAMRTDGVAPPSPLCRSPLHTAAPHRRHRPGCPWPGPAGSGTAFPSTPPPPTLSSGLYAVPPPPSAVPATATGTVDLFEFAMGRSPVLPRPATVGSMATTGATRGKTTRGRVGERGSSGFALPAYSTGNDSHASFSPAPPHPLGGPGAALGNAAHAQRHRHAQNTSNLFAASEPAAPSFPSHSIDRFTSGNANAAHASALSHHHHQQQHQQQHTDTCDSRSLGDSVNISANRNVSSSSPKAASGGAGGQPSLTETLLRRSGDDPSPTPAAGTGERWRPEEARGGGRSGGVSGHSEGDGLYLSSLSRVAQMQPRLSFPSPSFEPPQSGHPSDVGSPPKGRAASPAPPAGNDGGGGGVAGLPSPLTCWGRPPPPPTPAAAGGDLSSSQALRSATGTQPIHPSVGGNQHRGNSRNHTVRKMSSACPPLQQHLVLRLQFEQDSRPPPISPWPLANNGGNSVNSAVNSDLVVKDGERDAAGDEGSLNPLRPLTSHHHHHKPCSQSGNMENSANAAAGSSGAAKVSTWDCSAASAPAVAAAGTAADAPSPSRSSPSKARLHPGSSSGSHRTVEAAS